MSVTATTPVNPSQLTQELTTATGMEGSLTIEGDLTTAGAVLRSGQWTDAQITAALAAVTYTAPFSTAPARANLTTLLGQQAALGAQLHADITAVTAGWQTLSAADQTAIMLRVLNGFGTTMTAIADHLAVNGIGNPP